MPLLITQFNAALSNVEPTEKDKTNAPLAHGEVREALTSNRQLVSWGLDPVLIGSYKRSVSIRRIKDVDMFARLHELSEAVGPGELMGTFREVLISEFGAGRVKQQARSLQVAFPQMDALYVDVVPARPFKTNFDESVWQIPKHGLGGWQTTNPLRLEAIKVQLNDDSDGNYVPVVKLLRQTRRSLMGRRKPGGLTIEMAATSAFMSRGPLGGNSVPELYAWALRQVGEHLQDAFVHMKGLPDPTLKGAYVDVAGSDLDKRELAEAFLSAATAAERAINASSENKCQAAQEIRRILGKAVDDLGAQDFVFPMPEDCNEDGSWKSFARVRAGDSTIPGGDRRFG